MKWLKRLLEKIFKNRKIKYIEFPREENKTEETKSDFRIMLKQTADLEQNDGNGYKIMPKLNLKDMV